MEHSVKSSGGFVNAARQNAVRRTREHDPGAIVPVYDGKAKRWVAAKVSPADWSLALSRRWHLDAYGYPRCLVYGPGGKRLAALFLHRLVCRAPDDLQVDHVRHDLLDCRRSQLRLATRSQNSANRRRPRLGYTPSSRYRGVTFHRQAKKWQAGCGYAGQFIYAGLFENERDAALAYDRLARQLWGEFAILNLPEQASAGRAA